MEGLKQVLAADPRSVYRKTKCKGELYPVCFDRLNAWCLFGDEQAHNGEAEARPSPTVSVQRIFLYEDRVRLPSRARGTPPGD